MKKLPLIIGNFKFYLKRLQRKLDHKFTLLGLKCIVKLFQVNPSSNPEKKSIICFITENIGDTIRASSMIEFLASQYNCYFACTEYNRAILNLCGVKDERIISLNRDPGFLDLIKIFKVTRVYRWDTSIILDYTSVKNFGIYASKFSGIRNVIYKNFTESDIEGLKSYSDSENVDILTLAKYAIVKDTIDLPLGKKIKSITSEKFHHYRDYIGIHVGGFGSILYPVSRKYPEEYTFQLIKSLLEKGFKVLITGDDFDGKSFKEFSEQLSKYDGFVDLTGRLTISELASLLKSIRIYVTPDNGTLHLAQAVGCKDIVALLGPTSPYLVRGINTTILRVDLPCSPCLKFLNFPRKCINPIEHQCLWELKPEVVLSEILRKF